MAVSIKDIQKLREMTGAGLADCKKALEESNGEIEPAIEIIRKKGQAVAAKRSDREASEGCVLVKVDGNFAAIIALKCETDFVANNADFVKLTQDILDAAVAARCKTLDEVKALPMGNGTVAEAVVDRSGITGEKMELDGYSVVEGECIAAYNHQNKNTLCTLVALNKCVEDATVGKNVAMQVASASPVAVDAAAVPQETIDSELRVAVEKTKEEQIAKAVEAAIRKAGVNPAHVDSEDHIESNMAKGWITPEQAQMVREIKEKVAAEKAANLPEQMIQNIAQGRLKKFFKENCLLEQEFIWDKNMTVEQYLHSVDKELTVTAFKRFTLRAE
ncbi:MAG: translation elongation factor Ts [Bacteroidaceae bacterium]|nr:translation elongation factor Ts [Bacteroidaceae bacterium]